MALASPVVSSLVLQVSIFNRQEYGPQAVLLTITELTREGNRLYTCAVADSGTGQDTCAVADSGIGQGGVQPLDLGCAMYAQRLISLLAQGGLLVELIPLEH